ncbi:MAG: hypothetical protein ABII22_06705 [Candidatus Micrarchaeota archaeon]
MSKLFCPKCKKGVVLLGGDVVDERTEELMQKIKDEGNIPMMKGYPPVGYKLLCPVCQTVLQKKR